MKKVRKLKFALLGLGTVVKLRVSNIFKNELKKNIKVVCVFDKDKNKRSKYSKKFDCKQSKNEKEFF